MTMSPGVRKLALTAHVTSSVGWLGAVAAFLALAIAGVTSGDGESARAAYLAMDITGWYVIVPLCFASLVTGLVQSLGTHWGLFRHWWVLLKLLMTILASAVLLLHMQPVTHMARIAAESTLSASDFRGLRMQLITDAAAALVVLLIAATLSVFKPQGLTRYGWRKQREEQR